MLDGVRISDGERARRATTVRRLAGKFGDVLKSKVRTKRFVRDPRRVRAACARRTQRGGRDAGGRARAQVQLEPFGSFASGLDTRDSDMDLALSVPTGVPPTHSEAVRARPTRFAAVGGATGPLRPRAPADPPASPPHACGVT